MSTSIIHHPSSYRDPSGFIFEKEGVLYRQVNKIFKDDFDFFISSGCYADLLKKGLLIPHENISENLTGSTDCYQVIKPAAIDFISYPYEWSFDMLKDAALLTLQLAREAIRFGLIIKDATPYNIQWHQGKLIFIDTLSFEKYNEKKPWIAYRQFCEMFLGPLLLMHYRKLPLQALQLAYPEGIPLIITKSLLPGRSKFSIHTWLHIHMHGRVASNASSSNNPKIVFSKQKMLNLLGSLENLIKGLKLPSQKSTWSDYYNEASQRQDYLEEKKAIINSWISKTGNIKKAVDLGANDGVFSKLIAQQNIAVIAADFDPFCINNLYVEIKQSGEKKVQPLILDLANPSPGIGVNNAERTSFTNRIKADLAMALAVIHHLVIGKNIPFENVADFFSQAGNYLLIEFVPKEDEKIKLMLQQKKDIYTNYNAENFEKAFDRHFTVIKKVNVGNSGRILYLMKRHG